MTATRTDRGSTETTTVSTEGQDLVMERVFDAPRELVWQVMNDPARVTNWWGPHGYTTTVEEMDVRPGGQWRWINHTTDGEDAPFKGEYLEAALSTGMVGGALQTWDRLADELANG